MRPATYQNQAAGDNIKDDSRGEIDKLLAEDLQLSNFAKKSKNPSISEVPIHFCVGIYHS